MERLFKALRNSGLKIHNKKCDILKKKVHFIGHIFGEEGVETEPGKIEAMQNFPRPHTKKTLRSFIGLVSYYRPFIKNLSHDISAMLDLLRKGVKYVRTDKHEKGFCNIKEKLQSLPTLAYIDEGKDAPALILQRDASNPAIAGVLSQMSRDGTAENLIACYGRNLKPNEANWTISEKEILAVVAATIKFRHLIVGKQLIVRSDNLSVKYFADVKGSANQRIVRWNLALADILYNTTFEFVKGESNFVDALSRRSYDKDDTVTKEELEVLYDRMTVNTMAKDVDLNVEAEEDESADENEMEEWLEEYKIKEWQQEAGFEEIENDESEGESESSEEDIYQPVSKDTKKVLKTKRYSVRVKESELSESDQDDNDEDDGRLFGEENAYSFGLDDSELNRFVMQGHVQEMTDKYAEKIKNIQDGRLERGINIC